MGEDQSDDLELDGPITLRILDGIAWDFAQAKWWKWWKTLRCGGSILSYCPRNPHGKAGNEERRRRSKCLKQVCPQFGSSRECKFGLIPKILPIIVDENNSLTCSTSTKITSKTCRDFFDWSSPWTKKKTDKNYNMSEKVVTPPTYLPESHLALHQQNFGHSNLKDIFWMS